MAKAKERVWESFLASFMLPIFGGLINYFIKRKTNKDLAIICLIASVFHPFLIILILGTSGWFLFLFILLLLNWFLITQILRENKYRYFLPTFYFGIIGAVYSYLKYKGNDYLQKNVLLFVVVGFVIVFIIMIFAAILASWAVTFSAARVSELEAAVIK